MALNPYSRTAEQKILPYNTDLIAGLAEYNQKRYDTASGEYDELLGAFNKILALEQDIPKRQEAIDQYRKALSDAHSKTQGDYAKMLPVLKRLKNDFQNDLAYGKLGAIITQYNNAAAYNKEVDDKLAKGEIDARTADLLKQDANLRYKNIGEPDQFGRYSGKYQGRTPVKHIDPYELTDKIVKGWEANKLATENGLRFSEDSQGRRYMLNKKGEHIYVNGNEIKEFTKQMLNQNPDFQASADQQTWVDNYGIDINSEIYGSDQHGNQVQINPEAYIKNYRNSLTEGPANFMGAKYGYDQDSYSNTLKEDSYGLKAYDPTFVSKNIETLSSPLRKNKVTENLTLDDILNKTKFNSNGSIADNELVKFNSQAPTGNPLGVGTVNPTGTKINTKPEALKYLATQVTKNPELKGLNPKEAFEVLKTANESLASSNATILKPGYNTLKTVNNTIFGEGEAYGDLHERPIYIIDANGNKSKVDYKVVAKSLGYGDNIPKEALKSSSITGVDVAGEDAGDFTATIPDKDGNPTTLYIGSNDATKKVAQVSGKVNSLLYQGGGTAVVGDVKIIVNNKLDVKSKKYDPEITLENSKGEKETLTLSELSQFTGERLQNILNSNKKK